MKGIIFSKAEVERHNQRHGFTGASPASQKRVEPGKVPKARQNKTELAYGLILEAMKRRGEIVDYRPFGIKLEWGADPKTGKPMVYSGDFTVFHHPPSAAAIPLTAVLPVTIVECKGPYIYPQDWIRFKGCRAEWPMFRFELHQKTKEGWRKVL